MITATSGAAIAQSSAIWPGPRIPISRTSTSVPSGAARTASGRPISVLKFSGLAWTWAGRIARQTSLTEVFPVEPVIPTHSRPELCAPVPRERLERGEWRIVRPRIQPEPPSSA